MRHDKKGADTRSDGVLKVVGNWTAGFWPCGRKPKGSKDYTRKDLASMRGVLSMMRAG